MKSILMSSLLAFIFMGQIGCESRDGSGGSAVSVNPQSTPTPSPTPGPNPTPARLWTQVIDESYTDVISPETCSNPRLLFITSGGRYTAGPCLQGESKKRGSITSDELRELDRRVRILMSFDLTKTPECEAMGPIAAQYADLELPPGSIYRVYDANPGKTCYRGDKEASTQLWNYMGLLMEKYYPWHTRP